MMRRFDNATKVASPGRAVFYGAATSVAEDCKTDYLNAIEIVSPRGVATSVAEESEIK